MTPDRRLATGLLLYAAFVTVAVIVLAQHWVRCR